MDRLLKGLQCGLTNLDNRMSENIQNSQRSHKLHLESCGKLESELVGGGKSLSRLKLKKRYSRETHSHHYWLLQWCHWIIYFWNTQRATNLKNSKKKLITLWYQVIYQNWKRTRNPYTENKNIQQGYRNGISNWIMYNAGKAKGKRETIEGIELPN